MSQKTKREMKMEKMLFSSPVFTAHNSLQSPYALKLLKGLKSTN